MNMQVACRLQPGDEIAIKGVPTKIVDIIVVHQEPGYKQKRWFVLPDGSVISSSMPSVQLRKDRSLVECLTDAYAFGQIAYSLQNGNILYTHNTGWTHMKNCHCWETYLLKPLDGIYEVEGYDIFKDAGISTHVAVELALDHLGLSGEPLTNQIDAIPVMEQVCAQDLEYEPSPKKEMPFENRWPKRVEPSVERWRRFNIETVEHPYW